MFERFTDRSRHVVVLAQEAARLLRHDYIGTEHLLIALAEPSRRTVASRVLIDDLRLPEEAIRLQVVERAAPGTDEPSGHIPFTDNAKRALELSLRESLEAGSETIRTEHLLLGLVRVGRGVAHEILVAAGAEVEAVRRAVGEARSHMEPDESGEPAEAAGHARMVRAFARMRGGSGSEAARTAMELAEHIASLDSRLERIELHLERIERHLGVKDTDETA